MAAYYNEVNPFAVEWLRNLIAEGLIADGVVDSRSIVDVAADDIRGFTQCHFFAGIGVWSHALRIAGIPDDYPIWTGSCPCQPFSVAGKGKGTDDERHLWPELFRLIRECRPATVVGEQVEAAIRHGWLDGVFADLEAEDYACGAVVLGAHSVGAPHIRQRLWWVAKSGSTERRRRTESTGEHGGALHAADSCGVDGLAHCDESGRLPGSGERCCGDGCGLGESVSPRLEGHAGHGDGCDQSGRLAAIKDRPVAASGGVDLRIPDAAQRRRRELRGESDAGSGGHDDRSGSADHWSDYEWVWCRDGKARRLEPGLEPLVDGFAFRLADGRARSDTSRREILHAIGNAIVPQVAAEFLMAAVVSE